ncbi:MAG: hypothetical protein P1U58_14195 [Verrucomicrobiales bacterium]|nr:hypothetical protein [Verrucomicrobiales bacterium]
MLSSENTSRILFDLPPRSLGAPVLGVLFGLRQIKAERICPLVTMARRIVPGASDLRSHEHFPKTHRLHDIAPEVGQPQPSITLRFQSFEEFTRAHWRFLFLAIARVLFFNMASRHRTPSQFEGKTVNKSYRSIFQFRFLPPSSFCKLLQAFASFCKLLRRLGCRGATVALGQSWEIGPDWLRLHSLDRVAVAKIESQIRSVLDFELAILASELGVHPDALLPSLRSLKPDLDDLIAGKRDEAGK